MLEPNNKKLSIRWQCEALSVSRSSFYYKPSDGSDKEDSERKVKTVMKVIHTMRNVYGYRRMCAMLQRMHHNVTPKVVRRMMREENMQGVCPKRHTSKSNAQHKKFPYLVKERPVVRPNQLWASDITLIRLPTGWCYLVAVLDWYSRMVVSWELSNTMTADLCISALDKALRRGKPEMFNTDQGSQFTSDAFIGRLEADGIRISMDSKGRAYDNIIVERFWRTAKYEEVFLNDYESISEAREALRKFFDWYNSGRPHQALNYRTPKEVYYNLPKRMFTLAELVKEWGWPGMMANGSGPSFRATPSRRGPLPRAGALA